MDPPIQSEFLSGGALTVRHAMYEEHEESGTIDPALVLLFFGSQLSSALYSLDLPIVEIRVVSEWMRRYLGQGKTKQKHDLGD
jgi:hypothetical protein